MPSEQFAEDGFLMVEDVISSVECAELLAQTRPEGGGTAGSRSLLAQSWCAALSRTIRRHSTLSELMPETFVAVQCTYFEKSSSQNWLVPIHQDLSIPVEERVDGPSLSGWSIKEGSLFVQPPPSVLAQLMAVRLHLDACSEQDGPLRVVPGSHTLGVLSPEAAATARQAGTEVSCTAQRCAALVMRPLLLHASSKAKGTSRRRVLHFLFGPPELPFGLRWSVAVRTQ